MNILDEIIKNKKREVEAFKKQFPLDEIVGKLPRTVSHFSKILSPLNGRIGIIAEIKIKSPSEGKLIADDTLKILEITKKLVNEYSQLPVDAISLVTDEKYFGGNIFMVEEAVMVKESNNQTLPILQKDFVIDPIQIYYAKLLGADALLLIARILDQEELQEFVSICSKIGIEPIVEIYSEDDLKKTLKTSAKFIGVNARNLNTFEININNACNLINKIPKEKSVIGFSGISNKDDVIKYKNAGANAVLIGTNLLQAKDKKKFIESLVI